MEEIGLRKNQEFIYDDPPIDRRGTSVVNDGKLMMHYRSLFKKYRPAVVLTYTAKPNVYASLVALQLHIPVINNVTGLGSVVNESGIKQKFIKVCGMVGEDKDDFLASCREITEALCDSAALDKQIENLLVRADELTAVMQGFIRENAEHEQDQDLYNQKYAEYEKQMNTVEEEIQRLRQKKADQIARKELLEGMIREIEENDLTVTEFDEKLWRLMVESVEVCENSKLMFTLRNGMEIEV